MTGNRKLIPFLAFIGVTAVLRALGRITDATCDHQNELALWLFIGANAAEHLGPAARDLLGTIKAKGQTMKNPEVVNEETIEVTIARLLERDESQWKALEEIKRTIERVQTKLDNRLSEPLPCIENNRRLDNLEKQVADDHEPRLKDVEKFQSNLNGKLAVWGIVVIVVANLISGVVIAYLAGLIGH